MSWEMWVAVKGSEQEATLFPGVEGGAFPGGEVYPSSGRRGVEVELWRKGILGH